MARTTIEATTELGKRLEDEREKQELGKEAWCAKLNISRPTYDRWLTRPTPNMDFNNIRRIAVVLGISIDTVFGWISVDVPIIHEMTPRWVVRPIEAYAAHGILKAA